MTVCCLQGSSNTAGFANSGAAIKQCVINDLVGEPKESGKTPFGATLFFTYLNEITLNSRQPKGLAITWLCLK
jgi:hypothetical protein